MHATTTDTAKAACRRAKRLFSLTTMRDYGALIRSEAYRKLVLGCEWRSGGCVKDTPSAIRLRIIERCIEHSEKGVCGKAWRLLRRVLQAHTVVEH